jgi:hypothetical protein
MKIRCLGEIFLKKIALILFSWILFSCSLFQKPEMQTEIGPFYHNVDIGKFISLWDTMTIYEGSTNEYQIKLPLDQDGIYDFIVEWGDNSSNQITTFNDPETTHSYQYAKKYEIKISGILKGFRFNNSGDMKKLMEIRQWGKLNLGNKGSYFSGCLNLTISAKDILDLTGTSNLNSAFSSCKSLISVPSINDWDLSGVTDTSYMFYGALLFNQYIGDWNLSNIQNMESMFSSASKFNQNIGSWNISSVTKTDNMFYNSASFDQDISSWNMSKVKSMDSMFSGTKLSVNNYDALLIGWSKLQLQYDVTFSGGYSYYSNKAELSRQKMISYYRWSISDSGITAEVNNGG